MDDIIILAEEEHKGIGSAEGKNRILMKHMLEDAVPYLYLAGRVVFSSIINTGGKPSPFYKINCILEELQPTIGILLNGIKSKWHR